ncbi:MAG: helix-turn-helix transcriptional regulator [Clostridiales bacterium]|uniref:helix-turn-helix domain-containing protein n=1 Tax=Zhenhengia sp. TaxID=2944208 RepID=UPI002910E63F|nr:helix-turn-helix transcriptional regulator [Clostridiales bacterium]
MNTFPIIDVQATGANILRLRKLNGLSVKDLQVYFGFEGPQAIYKWQWGQCLPSVDNLFALSKLFNTSIDEILVERHSAEVSFLLFKIFICAIKGISCEKA